MRPIDCHLLIGILSRRDDENARCVCRETWVGEANRLEGVRCVFLLAGGRGRRPALEGDRLYLPVEDRYETLQTRVRQFCGWGCENSSAEVFFKCDDDTFVVPERLLHRSLWEEPRHYTGFDIGSRQGYPPYGSGGAGYLLSRHAAGIIAADDSPDDYWEDKGIGLALLRHGIRLSPDARFVPYGELAGWPAPENALISAHQPKDIDRFREIHARFSDREGSPTGSVALASREAGRVDESPGAALVRSRRMSPFRGVLIAAIHFYRRWLSGRGPLRGVVCTFHSLESCSAFGLRAAHEAPTARVAAAWIVRRLVRCQTLSIFQLSEGGFAWARGYDGFLRGGPSPSAVRSRARASLASCGECEDVQREVSFVAGVIAEAARRADGRLARAVYVSLPLRDGAALRSALRNRLLRRSATAVAVAVLGIFLSAEGGPWRWVGLSLLPLALLAAGAAIMIVPLTRRLARLEATKR